MLKQPVGFKKLTNVALIKLKKGRNRFEIACYKNKALDYRNGLEENINEVLQIDEIYSNAVSGELANKADLEASFPKTSKMEIIRMVDCFDRLDSGERRDAGVGQRARIPSPEH